MHHTPYPLDRILLFCPFCAYCLYIVNTTPTISIPTHYRRYSLTATVHTDNNSTYVHTADKTDRQYITILPTVLHRQYILQHKYECKFQIWTRYPAYTFDHIPSAYPLDRRNLYPIRVIPNQREKSLSLVEVFVLKKVYKGNPTCSIKTKHCEGGSTLQICNSAAYSPVLTRHNPRYTPCWACCRDQPWFPTCFVLGLNLTKVDANRTWRLWGVSPTWVGACRLVSSTTVDDTRSCAYTIFSQTDWLNSTWTN